MRKIKLLLLLLFTAPVLWAQGVDRANEFSNVPRLVPQTGLATDLPAKFSFSAKNNYLYAVSQQGEYVLYDLRSSRLIKRLEAPVQSLGPLIYAPVADFSEDESLLLIPKYPEGSYLLFDLQADKDIFRFIPPAGQYYTHALFAADRKTILFISEQPGKNAPVGLYIFTTEGRLQKKCTLTLPPFLSGTVGTIVNILMARKLKIIEATSKIISVAASADLSHIYMGLQANNLQTFNIGKAQPDGEYILDESTAVKMEGHDAAITQVKINGGKLIAKSVQRFDESQWKKSQVENVVDTIFVMDIATRKIEKTIVATAPVVIAPYNSSPVNCLPLTVNDAMNVYLTHTITGTGDYTITGKNILTGKELFSYKRGTPVYSIMNNNYEPGELHGGKIVAISGDGKLAAESAGNLIIHNLETNKIRNNFSIIRGGLRLNKPMFIDSFRLMIPKITNDAFIFDTRTAVTERLSREISCEDTARNGINTLFAIDRNAVVGLENAAITPDHKKIAVINYFPGNYCGQPKEKTIDVYDASLKPLAHYKFTDEESSYHFSFVPAEIPTFLVYFKLVSFPGSSQPVIKELTIKQKKNIFYAYSPVYLGQSKSIFTIMGTRLAPGSPNLIFAQYDPEGKLLSSYEYKRDKTPYEFQTFITDSRLSPDSSRLLFCLHDGTAGIFDIKQMKMLALFEHGEAFSLKALGAYEHTVILSGCFLNNDHFATCGTDGNIMLWDISQAKPLKKINREPVFLYGMILSPDGKYFIGSAIDKTILFIEKNTGNVAFRFLAGDYESTAIVASDGYYSATRKMNRSLGFLHAGKAYDFTQFDLYMNRPDKIIEKFNQGPSQLSALYQKAWEKRIEKAGVRSAGNKFEGNYQAPDIELKGLPEERSQTNSENISFTVSIKAAPYSPDRLFITVNGVPLYGVKGVKLKNVPADNALSVPVSIPLSSGKNDILVSVRNNVGIQSLSENFSINKLVGIAKPTLQLICIGSGKFADKKKNLFYPSKDASDIAALFNDKKGMFGEIKQTLLLDEKVTKSALLFLRQKLLLTKPDDYVIIFYAGHGIIDANLNYFLSTYATDFSRPALQAISYEDFESLLDSIPARNKILLLDACHSGEIDKSSVNIKHEFTSNPSFRSAGLNITADNDYFTLTQSLFFDLRTSNGTTVIGASGAAEDALESGKWDNGVFTHCLLEGLRNKAGDLNKDGQINISELLEYVQDEVTTLTHGKQQPTGRQENLVNDIRIW